MLMTPEELRRKLVQQSADPRTRGIVPVVVSEDPRMQRYGSMGWKDYATAPLKAALMPVHMVYSGGKWVVDKIWENPKAAAAIALGAAGIWGMSRGYHAPPEFLESYPNASNIISAMKEGYNSAGNAKDVLKGAGKSALHGAYAVGNLLRLRPMVAAGHSVSALKEMARSARGAARSAEAGGAAAGRLWKMTKTGMGYLSPMWDTAREASDYGKKAAEAISPVVPPLPPPPPPKLVKLAVTTGQKAKVMANATKLVKTAASVPPNSTITVPNTPAWKSALIAIGVTSIITAGTQLAIKAGEVLGQNALTGAISILG